MQIAISGHQMDITQPLKDYVTEKMDRIGRHFDNLTNTTVVLHVEKTRHLAEATINTKGNNNANHEASRYLRRNTNHTNPTKTKTNKTSNRTSASLSVQSNTDWALIEA